jgi:hypothetical protein
MLYKDVYFRLDQNGYNGHSGWEDKLRAKSFFDEITGIFLNDGWMLANAEEMQKYRWCPEIQKGLQELYLHPQAASGIVIAEDIPHIAAMLAGAQTFRHSHTDVYEDYLLMPDDEYLRLLEGKRDEIAKDILERFRTKRRNLYFRGLDALQSVCKEYRVKRVGKQDKHNDLEAPFIYGVLQELLARGLILTSKLRDGADGYRTAKDGEIAVKQQSA